MAFTCAPRHPGPLDHLIGVNVSPFPTTAFLSTLPWVALALAYAVFLALIRVWLGHARVTEGVALAGADYAVFRLNDVHECVH